MILAILKEKIIFFTFFKGSWQLKLIRLNQQLIDFSFIINAEALCG